MNISLPGMISFVAIVGAFSILGGLALLIYHVLEREKKIEEQEKKALAEYQDIMKKAHAQASELLDKTTDASKKVLSQVTSTNEDMTKNLDKTLQSLAEKHIQSLSHEAASFKKEYDEKIIQMQQLINQDVQKTLQSFSQTLMTKTTSSEQAIDDQTKALIAAADKEVAAYKKQRMEKIDSEVVKLVQKTCQDILGLSIPPETHRELILKALEKSKQEGVFEA